MASSSARDRVGRHIADQQVTTLEQERDLLCRAFDQLDPILFTLYTGLHPETAGRIVDQRTFYQWRQAYLKKHNKLPGVLSIMQRCGWVPETHFVDPKWQSVILEQVAEFLHPERVR